MISDMLLSSGIRSFAAMPVSEAKVIKPYLLRDFTPEAYAIFAVIPYYTGRKSNLASFAAVPDYHAFAQSAPGEVADYIKAKYGKNVACFADHSPFDEVSSAAACGLGIIGDHGLIITKAHSSFVCLGEIVCDLGEAELSSEGVPVIGKAMPIQTCEHCGRCAEACPTGALGDKSRCLSAISQKKGELTEAEAASLRSSAYVWGCDVCQLLCPHTKSAAEAGTLETEIPYFRSGFIAEMTEKYISQMTDEEYKKYTFSWRSREIMIRNLRAKGERRD